MSGYWDTRAGRRAKRVQQLNEVNLKHLEIVELREQRKALAMQINGWRKEISETNRANLADGVPLGLSADEGWMRRRVDRASKVQTLKIDAEHAEELLRDMDCKLAVIEADNAEKEVRAAIAQLQKAETPATWVALRDGLFMLRHHRRIGQSADMIRKKIERLSQPGAPQAVRVRNEKVTDFLMWLPKAKEEVAA